MIRLLVFFFCAFSITTATAQQEVIYHVATRSFFDSNGDGQGDIKGIQQKLSYLNQLGVTTISLTPIYTSDFYQNLYATDLEKIDPDFGVFKEYRDLIQEAHRAKMKLYLEVDIQYVSSKHPWFTDSYKNIKSAYSDYIYYTDAKNEKPVSPRGNIVDNPDGEAVAVNLKNAKVKEYATKVFKYWADPNGDGDFYDGADGFRLHGIKDKLDNTSKMSNLLKEFWNPLIAGVKKINPKIQLLAVPDSVKSFGNEFYVKANADRVLASKLREAIVSFDKQKISIAADSTFLHLDKDKIPVVYIESEDTDRFASGKGMDAGKIRAGAGLNFLMGGVPSVYYGQELGMKGELSKHDINNNTVAEKFPWQANENGISLEEQQKDPNSLWSYYKQLIRFKKLHPAIALGTYSEVPNGNWKVFSFLRTHDIETILVIINLSNTAQLVSMDNDLRVDKLKLLLGTPNSSFPNGGRAIKLPPYAVQVWSFLP